MTPASELGVAREMSMNRIVGLLGRGAGESSSRLCQDDDPAGDGSTFALLFFAASDDLDLVEECGGRPLRA